MLERRCIIVGNVKGIGMHILDKGLRTLVRYKTERSVSEYLSMMRADQAAVGTVNRPLRPIGSAFATH